MSNAVNFEYAGKRGQPIAIYSYQDAGGNVIFEKERHLPKSFRFRRKEGDQYVYNLGGVAPLPYRLPAWITEPHVIVAEGEKDADTLADLGFCSTSSPFGAGNWPEKLTPWFKGKLVYLLYDVGEEDNADKVAANLFGTAREIFICKLPSEVYEFDISDLLATIPDRPQKITAVKDLLRNAAIYSPPKVKVYVAPDPDMRLVDDSFPDIQSDFIRRYIESVSKVTDAPRSFIGFSAIGMLSGILNRHYFCYPRRVNLNLYILLLAASTISRKSVTLDIANDYINEVDPEIIFPESFTPEALLSHLSKKNCGLIVWRELIQVAGFAFGSDYNKALPSLLTDLYDSKTRFRRITRGSAPFDIRNPSISILAAGIQSWLINMMTGQENEFYGGLWTRFLFISGPEEQDKPFRLPSRLEIQPEIVSELRALYEMTEDKEIDLAPIRGLLKTWGQQHLEQSRKIDRPEMQASFQRLEIALLKIAGLLQLADDPESIAIEEKAYYAAIKIIDMVKDQLPVFFEKHVHFTRFQRKRAAIIQNLQNRGPMLLSQIYRVCGLSAKEAVPILEQLKDENLIQEIRVPPTEKGGRIGKVYELKGKPS